MFRPHPLHAALALAGLVLSAAAGAAPSPEALDEIVVVGSAERAALQPGSVHVLDRDDLERARVLSVNEALRKVPGLVVRDEEGFGLRPNIGVRGLNPTRSTKILLLEDGLPFNYAPYGDNASYFHAPIERYERIEVLKGSGTLRFGPQTIGGVVNYLTPAPPEAAGGSVDVSVGSAGYRRVRAALGGAGHLVDVMSKRGDGARDHQALRQHDLLYKHARTLGEDDRLVLRASHLREDSDVTYSGLTEAEYRNFGPRYNPFADDHFDIERFGASATWTHAFGPAAELATSAYGYEFHRDWGRQSSSTTDTQCGAAFAAARLAGERVDASGCRSRQNRNRDFTTWGVEPRLRMDWSVAGMPAQLEAGVRLHRETQRRLQLNGSTPTASTGTLAEHNERGVRALSAFVQNRLDTGRFALVPALRYEHVELERVNRLGGRRAGRATVAEGIGGLGLTAPLGSRATLFAGVHEGFAPPRVEDLIGNDGGSVELDPERSRNLELGVRGTLGAAATYEIAAFDNDFSNQVAVGSIAGGSTPLAQGEARYRGVELALRARLAPWGGVLPFLESAVTWLPTARQDAPLRRVDTGQPVPGSAAGRRMPYAPRATATLRGGLEGDRWDASIEAVAVAAQFADFANTPAAAAFGHGQTGRLGGHTLIHLAANRELGDSGWTLYASLKNALDRRYIADRTRGILPGGERQLVVGAAWRF